MAYTLKLDDIGVDKLQNGTEANATLASGFHLNLSGDAEADASLTLLYSSASDKAQFTWSSATGQGLALSGQDWIVVNASAGATAVASGNSFSYASWAASGKFAPVSITLTPSTVKGGTVSVTAGSTALTGLAKKDAEIVLTDAADAKFTSFKINAGAISSFTATGSTSAAYNGEAVLKND